MVVEHRRDVVDVLVYCKSHCGVTARECKRASETHEIAAIVSMNS
jgi:hypothetical protein